MTQDWDALEELSKETADERDAAWQEHQAALRSQVETLAPVMELLAEQDRALDADGALEQIRDRFLAGAGVIQRTTFEYGIERMRVLAWPAALDPRAGLAAREGEYHVEVWVGVNENMRPRVRVVGEKRLEATLPVSAEKFRAALLGALRAPKFTPAGETAVPVEESATEEAPPAESPGVAGGGTDAPEPGKSPAAPATPAPDEDQPIAMGPAGAEPGKDTPAQPEHPEP